MKTTLFHSKSWLAVAGLALSACGPSTFVPNPSGLKASAGFMDIPPRVDIVLGVSTSGTMRNIFPGIQNEIPAFTQNLENSGWDYRFISVPLHETSPGSGFPLDHNVSVSKFHGNYQAFGQWKSPFVGASASDPSLNLLSSLFAINFVLPTSFGTTPNDGREPGLQNLADFVSRSDVNTGASNTGLIRPDAMLAVIVLSNEDDKSGGTWRCKWDALLGGYPSSCPDYNREWVAPTPDNIQSLANRFVSAKGNNAQLVKYFALTAPATVGCRGYSARYGKRYGVDMVQALAASGSRMIDICANPLASALEQVRQNLVTQRLNFRKRYLVLNSKPNVGTIKVTKYANGQGSGELLVQGDPNGWRYLGGPQTVYTIDSPAPMGQATGYIIELLGNARLTGNDTANVDYINEGGVISN